MYRIGQQVIITGKSSPVHYFKPGEVVTIIKLPSEETESYCLSSKVYSNYYQHVSLQDFKPAQVKNNKEAVALLLQEEQEVQHVSRWTGGQNY